MGVWTAIGRMLVGEAPEPAPPPPEERENGLARLPAVDMTQVTDALRDFQAHMRAQEAERAEVLRILHLLPEALAALPRIAAQQDRLAEILGQSLAQARQRDGAIDAALARIADGIGHQTEVAGLIQQQLDVNMQAASGVAEGVSRLSQAVTDLAAGSRRNGELLEGVVSRAGEQDARHERSQRALRVWLLAVLAAAGLVLATAVVLGVLLIRARG
ncbi:MAG: hypothetical protein U0574_05900 [Phycisphaerales bacterium]